MTTHSMIGRRTFLAGALGAAVAGGAASCSFGEDDDVLPDPEGDAEGNGDASPGADAGPMVLRQSMVPVPHLDPHLGNPGSASGSLLIGGLMEGLLITGPDGSEVLPGLAEDWSVSDDGLVYTFTLRSEATWSNGDPIVAQDIPWNWERLLSPDLERPGGPLQAVAGWRVAGALAYLSGEADDFDTVGVKALDDRTVEFTLEVPNPDFPFHLANWQTSPINPATVEEFGTDWTDPENWVSNGPFVLESWVPNASAVLVPNENYWDIDNYHIDRWEIRFSDAGDSAEMLAYQADEIDTFRVEGDLAAVMTDPGLAEELEVSRSAQYRGLLLMSSHNEALQDPQVRRALSLAIDREALAELAEPDLPGFSHVPDAIPGNEDVPQTTFDFEQAKDLLAEAGYPDGEGMPTIQLLLPFQVVWVEAIAGMWEENLGLQTQIETVEVGVWRQKRFEVHPEDYAGYSYSNLGVQPPTLFKAVSESLGRRGFTEAMIAPTALAEIQELQADESLDASDRSEQVQAIQDANLDPVWQRYMDLVSEAETELDEAARNDLLIQAAAAREESQAAIPVLWGGYYFMVKPRVQNLRIEALDHVFQLAGVEISE